MKRRIATAILAVCLVLAGSACAAASSAASRREPAASARTPSPGTASAGTAVAATSTWQKAEQVPGLGSLVAKGGNSAITTMSCASPGNCSAGGFYQLKGTCCHDQAFVVSQVHGIWQHAKTVPGIAKLDGNHGSQISSISCSAAGNCGAGGSYTSGYYPGGHVAKSEAFVVSQVDGRWHSALEVPGIGTLNTLGQASVSAVSCTGPGSCTAVGSFADAHTVGTGCCRFAGFAVSEAGGSWKPAQKVTGTGFGPLSCSTPGNCSAIAGDAAVSQAGGTWGAPHTFAAAPGSTFGKPSINLISCASPGNCSAGGIGRKEARAVVVSQVNGTWGTVHAVRGIPLLLKRRSALVSTMSCTAPGTCTAGGYSFASVPAGSSTREYAAAYLVSERKGTWGDAQQIPGIARLSKNGYVTISAIACAPAGNCTAAGTYSTSSYNPDGSGPDQVFVVSQVNGAWGMPREVTATLGNVGQAGIAGLACPAAGKCSAGGGYWLKLRQVAFVISQVR